MICNNIFVVVLLSCAAFAIGGLSALKGSFAPSTGVLKTIYSENVSPSTTKGLLIDGGSGGSRLHIYEWAPRIFETIPPPISFPTTNEKYTGRISGGVQECWKEGQTKDELRAAVSAHFTPLINFARNNLAGLEHTFAKIPIWFKATGGARELTPEAREELLEMIRDMMSDDEFCPFYFQPEMARVISGEEEAVFSWACMNFLKGNLIPASQGMGQASSNSSFGTLDLGGSSTQIAFFLPSEDYMEGLYKLQIGGQKHWNVYTKSFLQFGINSSRRRHFRLLAINAINAHKTGNYTLYQISEGTPNPSTTQGTNFPVVASSANLHETSTMLEKSDGLPQISVINPCFHSGYKETVSSLLLDATEPDVATYDVTLIGPNKKQKVAGEQLGECLRELRPLMEKDANAYCNTVYHGECSIGGAYQPALPTQRGYNEFIGTSSYKMIWQFLRFGDGPASITHITKRAAEICSLSLAETVTYVKDHNLDQIDEKFLTTNQYFCFMASYTIVLLEDGYGFKEDSTITVLGKYNGYKTGWPLGAILHEINNLPWELDKTLNKYVYVKYTFAILIGLAIGSFITWAVMKEIIFKSGYSVLSSSDNGASYGSINRGRTDTGIQMVGGNMEIDKNLCDSNRSGQWKEDIAQYQTPFDGQKT